MSALTQVRAVVVLAAELGQSAYTALAAGRRLKLMATTGTESAAGTEITPGGGYTAGGSAVTFAAPTAQTGTYSGRIGNQAWSQTNMPATTVNGVDITDTAGTPVRVMWGPLTAAKTVNAGDTLSFPADSLVAQI